MSWWGELIRSFASGAAEGAIEGYLDRVTTRRAEPEYEDYSFRDHMRNLEHSTHDVRLVKMAPTTATFAIDVSDDQYAVIASWRGAAIYLSIPSRITFPPGGAPTDIIRILAERNKKLPHFDYDMIDDEDGAFFYVHGQTRVEALNAATFTGAIAEMAPAIAALDEYLLENGYARIA